MIIAVTGEGKTDFGIQEYGTTKWKWGPIEVYLRKIAQEEGVDISLEAIPRQDVEGVHLQGRTLKALNGKAVPSRKFSILMREREYQYGIYYCDADREAGTRNSSLPVALKTLEHRYQEVKQGLDACGVEKIPMIPLRMIENWIACDTYAIARAYQVDLSKMHRSMEGTRNYELLWGNKNNPNSDYPKHYLTRLIRQLDRRLEHETPDMEKYVEIAEEQEIDILRRNCPNSFERFYQDYIGMLELEYKKED